MNESIYDKINDYGSVKISLASPNDIRSWSFGEVRKPETINYRTYRPEKDGLFCERIFGPERDWECSCGKYKGTKFKGIICDRCGVKVTHSRVRRKRMGHINLAAPAVHIWFFKAMPSRLGSFLAMKTIDLEKIIYFQDYVVTDAGQSPLKVKQLLNEEEYREAIAKYGNSFKAAMGAEAIRSLLTALDLEHLGGELKAAMVKTSSKQKIKDLTKRLKIVNAVKASPNKPEWMVLDVVPVIPPDLRPLVMLESGNFATSDLNDLYRRIINRNNRLKKLMDLNAPEVIIRNEKRMLQQAVDALFDNGRCRRPVLGSNNRPLKSLADMIKGKQGRFRENLLGKRVDYSARSVIVVGPHLKLHQCGLPKKIALELFQPFIIRELKERGLADTIKSAKKMLERREERVWDILEKVIHQHPVLLNRAPTLHRMGIQAFEPVLVEGNAIMLHPLVCRGFNADFDGDQMAVHLPLSIEAQVEAHTLIMSTNSIFSPANGTPIVGPSQDIVLGNYYITVEHIGEKGEGMIFRNTAEAITAYEMGKATIHAKVKVGLPKGRKISSEEGITESTGIIETTPGRCIFNEMLPKELPFYNCIMNQKMLKTVINDCFELSDGRTSLGLLDDIKELGFKYATLAGLSFGLADLRVPPEKQDIIDRTQRIVDRIQKNYNDGVLTEGERYNQIIDAWTHARVAVTNAMMAGLKSDTREGSASKEDVSKYIKDNFDFLTAGFSLNEQEISEISRQLDELYGSEMRPSKSDLEKVLQAIEDRLMIEYPDEDKHPQKLPLPMYNHETPKNFEDNPKKKSEEIKNKWNKVPKELKKFFDEIIDSVNKKWESDPSKVSTLPGVYLFREKQTRKIVYVGIAGERRGQGLYERVVECHLLGKYPSSFRDHIREKICVKRPYLNPIYLMSDSGARGSIDQIQQLAGMRALMAKPSGEIIETPIKSNFREGLNVLEYFSSTHGARKGLADTALKTADSGYLTRKLADVAQNVIVNEIDCGTLQGITKTTLYKGEQVDIPLRELIVGRTARDNVRNPITDEMIVRENGVITPEAAEKIESLGLESIRIRSPLTCDSPLGICARCYGWDMSTGRLVEEGMAVGIIAAQSIGEPGTQLTMRTFHTGGIASREILESDQKATHTGIVEFRDLNEVPEPGSLIPEQERDKADILSQTARPAKSKWVVLKRNGEMAIFDDKGRELDKFKVPYGASVQVDNKQRVERGQRLFSWDPHMVPILAEIGGTIRFVDVVDGETMKIEEERKGQRGKPVIIEHKGDKHPQVIIEDESGKILDVHYLPAKARIELNEGQKVQAGQLLARQPRGQGGTQDITGGLPRVTEIFEARKPKEPAAMAEISGRVELKSDKRRGKMTIIIRSEKMEKEHHVPRDRHLNVHAGDNVEAGDPLTDGPLVPHDILRVKGEEALQGYLLAEVQNVYRSQNVTINDKHIEIILSQMMQKVEIDSVGDSSFLPGDIVPKRAFRKSGEELAGSLKISDAGDADLVDGQVYTKAEIEQANEKVEKLGGEPAKGKKPRPATAKTLLMGITKAALQSESFISAASFQETTKVLTEAALIGKVDELLGLKENVILGHLIPAGTAFKPHLEMKVKHLAKAPLPKELAELKETHEAEAQAEAAARAALGLE
jgi:DNA-directed RNA polymerase beta' subunit